MERRLTEASLILSIMLKVLLSCVLVSETTRGSDIATRGLNSTTLLVPVGEEAVTWPSGANDSCLEDVLARWYETARSSFYQYSDLTASMFSSRLLYQTLFTMSFDPSSLGKYCKLYKSTREESDRCPNSPNKAAILNGFALGDYFCLERLADYIFTMPCLSKQDGLGAFSTCNSEGVCPEYDSAPYVYTNPIEAFSYNDTITRMALDCKYLQCDIDCRQPLIMKQCGRIAASFVVDSLVRVFSSISTGLKTDTQNRNLWVSFPDECRRLMQVAKIDPPLDEVRSVSNATTASRTSTSSTRAGSTTGTVVTSGISTAGVIMNLSTTGTAANVSVTSMNITGLGSTAGSGLFTIGTSTVSVTGLGTIGAGSGSSMATAGGISTGRTVGSSASHAQSTPSIVTTAPNSPPKTRKEMESGARNRYEYTRLLLLLSLFAFLQARDF